MIVGGFPQDAPKPEVALPWERRVHPRLQPPLGRGARGIGRFLVAWVCCACALRDSAGGAQAHRGDADGGEGAGQDPMRIWSALKSRKEQRARNRRLMRTAGMLQRHSGATSASTQTYTLICCRTATTVIRGTSVCRLTPGQKWELHDGWYVAGHWRKQEPFLVDSAAKISEGNIAASACS